MIFSGSKKGQYYIIAAVILCSLALGLVYSSAVSAKGRTVFDDLKKNFETESSIALNGIISSDLEAFSTYDDFVQDFRRYALSRNVDFDLVYLLMYNNTIYVKSYIESEVIARNAFDSVRLNSTNSTQFAATNFVSITKDDAEYNFPFDDRQVQFKAIFEITAR